MFFNKVYRALDRWTSVVHVARKSLLAILCLILKVQLTHGLAWIPSQMFSPFYPTSFFNQPKVFKNPPARRCFRWSGSMLCVPCCFIYLISIFLQWHYPSIIQCYAFLCCHYWQSGYRSSPAICKLHFILFHIYHISYNTMYIISIFYYIIFHIHFPKRHYIHPFLMFESNLFIRRTLLRNQRGRALIWSDMNIFDPSFQLKSTQPPCLKFEIR